MKYQFESEEIEYCGDCPCCDSIRGCSLDVSEESFVYISYRRPADCPLVVISEKETTRVVSDGFTYDAKPKQFKCLGCLGYFYMLKVGNYCPNCGRRLEA